MVAGQRKGKPEVSLYALAACTEFLPSQDMGHRLTLEFIAKVLETEASNAALKARVKASESKENAMRHELTELRERARELAVKNGLMQHDIAHLTSALAVRSAWRPT